MNDTQAQANQALFDEWALVELMGHQKIAGHVTEATIAGGKFIRVDVPNAAGQIEFSRFYGPSSIYCISPVEKQIAVGLAVKMQVAPVSRYDFRQLATQPAPNEYDDLEND